MAQVLDDALSYRLSPRPAAIAKALVGLCHDIGLEVTADTVECFEQLTLLSDLSPIDLQGFLLARLVPAKQVPSLIAMLPDHLASLLLTSSGKPANQPPAHETALIRGRRVHP